LSREETERLTQILLGAALSRAVCSITELGIADQIEPGSPRSVDYLARATGTHERSLYRVLRFLASHELFQEKDNRQFDHTPLSRCLRSDSDGSFRAAGRMFHRIGPAWDGLHHAIRTGEPGFNEIFGQPLFDYVGVHPELVTLFDAGMTAIHGYETAAMMEAYDFRTIQVLADIGGGNGTLIGAVLQRYPKLKGWLYDLGHVVGRARETLEAFGVSDRCSVIEGNFFALLPAGADAYLFRHIIHDWPDEKSIQILHNCRKVIPDDGRILLVEFVVPAANEPSLAKDSDMAMLVFPGGMERTEEEYRSLFEQAGFRLSTVTPTSSAISVLEGRPV